MMFQQINYPNCNLSRFLSPRCYYTARRRNQVASNVIRCNASSNGNGIASHPTTDSQNQRSTMNDAVSRDDYGKFVRFLHLASPYVVGHRGRVFVIVLPGEIIVRKERLIPLLQDILLLHGLGVKIIIVAGAKEMIDRALQQHGRSPLLQGAYRVTDADTMRFAVEAAGSISTEIAAHLSKAPSIPMIRRHARGEGQLRFAPAVQVVSGNYVTAKRRGIVNGIDFGFMGQVRFIQTAAVQQQLDAGNIVLLTNVGVSASGELLNCNAYDVATHAAVELQADKMLCLTGDDVRQLHLPHYLPLVDAEARIQQAYDGEFDTSIDILGNGRVFSGSEDDTGSEDDNGWTRQHWISNVNPDGFAVSNKYNNSNGSGYSGSSNNRSYQTGRSSSSSIMDSSVEMMLDLDSWQQIGFPNAVVAAVVACRQGVKRAHLIDMETDGAMLLEMYTRDGINGVCMIAADLYSGCRAAEPVDCNGIARLMQILDDGGHKLPFLPEKCLDYLDRITVMEREGHVLAIAIVTSLGNAPDGLRTAELSAFIVDPSYRKQGLGDSLLDYVEQSMRRRGFKRVVMIAEQGSFEWFAQRSFEMMGEAAVSELLPEKRRKKASAVAKLYAKPILELDVSLDAPAGKRIGF